MTNRAITDVQKNMRSHIGQRVQAGWDSGVEEGIYRGQSPHNSTMSRIDLSYGIFLIHKLFVETMEGRWIGSCDGVGKREEGKGN